MNNKEYILNRETNKIELHFSKEEYQSLADAQKADLKRHYLFSGKLKAWVSRSSNNHYSAIQTAGKLGFADGGKTGERLTYAEQLERKAEKAEERAERYAQYAGNAEKRAENLQAGWKEVSKDWSYVTQPNINSSAGRSFTNQRNKIIDRYEKGFEEYRKSEYFKERAAIAQSSADQTELKSKSYLNNRIEECNKNIRSIQANIITAEERNNGAWLENLLERMETEMDKLAFFENCLDEIGGIQYNKDNVKAGYLVKIRGSWRKVVKANPKTVETKSESVPYTLNYPYAEIQEMKIPEGWTEPKQEKAENPFTVGDIVAMIFHKGSHMENLYRAFQIIKTTDKSVVIREIEVKNHVPIADSFKAGKEQSRKAVKKDRNGEFVVNYDNHYLYRYENKQEQEQSA